jgi:deoxyribonuclease V
VSRGYGAVGPDPFADPAALVAEQLRLGRLRPAPWVVPSGRFSAAGCFVAFARGEAGPGRPGDHAWVGAALVADDGAVLATAVVEGRAGAAYEPGLLALREGPMLLEALRALPDRPDVVLVDGTGRDHPRRAGLALHLGAVLDLPSVGVTHRLLVRRHDRPPPPGARGDRWPVVLDGETVAMWVCTASGTRPLVAHAAWRTDAEVAAEVVLRTGRGTARTPEPLRQARRVAREARSAGLTFDPAQARPARRTVDP